MHGTEEEVWSKHGQAVQLIQVVAIVSPSVVHTHPRHLSKSFPVFYFNQYCLSLFEYCLSLSEYCLSLFLASFFSTILNLATVTTNIFWSHLTGLILKATSPECRMQPHLEFTITNCHKMTITTITCATSLNFGLKLNLRRSKGRSGLNDSTCN